MSTDGPMLELVGRFRQILDRREGILKCFCDQGVQVEGWLKGELLYFLDLEQRAGRLAEFDREVAIGVGRKKVDLKLTFRSGAITHPSWVEIKHWLIGYQRGQKYGAGFAFGDPTSVGIKPDVEKLSYITTGGKYILILATANPGTDEWSSGVDKFNHKFSHLRLDSLTTPEDFPGSFFLGLLSVG